MTLGFLHVDFAPSQLYSITQAALRVPLIVAFLPCRIQLYQASRVRPDHRLFTAPSLSLAWSQLRQAP